MARRTLTEGETQAKQRTWVHAEWLDTLGSILCRVRAMQRRASGLQIAIPGPSYYWREPKKAAMSLFACFSASCTVTSRLTDHTSGLAKT